MGLETNYCQYKKCGKSVYSYNYFGTNKIEMIKALCKEHTNIYFFEGIPDYYKKPKPKEQ